MSDQSKISRLNNWAEIVLCNLDKIKDGSYVEEVLDCFKCELLPSLDYQDVFIEAKRFFDEHGKYPDQTFLNEVGFDPVAPGDFSYSILEDYLVTLKRFVNQLLASVALDADDEETAIELLQRNQTGVTQKTEIFGPDEALQEYRELKLLPSGLTHGIPEVDNIVKGVSYGSMEVVAASPGGGKTTYLLSSLYHACFTKGYVFALLSLEMTKRDVWYSLFSRHSLELGYDGLIGEKIKKGNLDDKEEEILSKVIEDWKENCQGQIVVMDPTDIPTISKAALNIKWKEIEEEIGRELDGVALDYIQLTRSYRPERSDAYSFVNDLISYFALLSRSYENSKKGLIVLLLSQVNREGDQRLGVRDEGDLRMLAEYNSLERDASVVVILHSDAGMRHSGFLRLQVCKNRTGMVMETMIDVPASFPYYKVGSNISYDELYHRPENAIEMVNQDLSGSGLDEEWMDEQSEFVRSS